MDERILDPCCGSKMFWFDRDNPDALFCDIRKLEREEYYPGRYIEIKPDVICSVTSLPFKDESFYLVVFDPPHIPDCGENSLMGLKYGKLPKDWKTFLHDGFLECMRVLKPNGVLVFKWNETRITLSEVLKCFPEEPLFGNRGRGRGNYTHWLCFMKDRETKEKKEEAQKEEKEEEDARCAEGLMGCPYCGYPFPSDNETSIALNGRSSWNFCPRCGKALKKKKRRLSLDLPHCRKSRF